MSPTKTEAEQKLEALEFIAPIVEAQMRFDQAITNRVIADGWNEAALWAERFDRLFRHIAKTNDSIRVSDVLEEHWQPRIHETIDHCRRMAGEPQAA